LLTRAAANAPGSSVFGAQAPVILHANPLQEREAMIYVTRLDHNTMVVNAELIATVESTPDTMLTLSNGHQFLVRDTVAEVVARVLEYRRQINGTLRVVSAPPDTGQPEKT
jgi:flagellar protein FlbD